jgi:ketosteroid isomerase-like protein
MIDDKRKKILLDYLDATVARDLDRIGSLLADDVKIWLPPSAEKHGLPRPLEGRENFLGLVRALHGGQLGDRPFFTPRSMTPFRFLVADDTVAVHLRTLGDMPNGAVYDNQYVFLYTFVGDKIAEIREFTDTSFINDFLEENAGAPAT